MKHLIILSAIVWLAWLLTGCATENTKAPCDYQGHFCGTKTKINQW